MKQILGLLWYCNLLHFPLDIKFYFKWVGKFRLAVAWVSTSNIYTTVEISHAPAGNGSSTPTPFPALRIADGGAFLIFPNNDKLQYLQITVKDASSNEKKIPPVYVQVDWRGKFWGIICLLYDFLLNTFTNFRATSQK